MTEEMDKHAREIFAGVMMMQHLDVELGEVGEDWAELSFVVSEKHGNYMGGLHGGAVSAVIDTVVFFPGVLLPNNRALTTEGLEVHYFRPAKMGERIRVRAEIIRNGKRMVTVEAKALNEKGAQIAHGIATLMDLKAG